MRHSFIHSVRYSSTLSSQYVSVAFVFENKERIVLSRLAIIDGFKLGLSKGL